MGNPILNDAKFGFAQKSSAFQKASVLRTVSDDSSNSSFHSPQAVTAKQRPVSEPDMSQWSQQWSVLAGHPKLYVETAGDTDSVFTDTEEVRRHWAVLNMTLVVGYLSSTELILNPRDSEGDCLKAIRERIRQLGTEQNTHTLVMMKIMFDCIQLCDDAGAVLAAFPAENLVLGAVCTEDPRFFCLVTTAHIINGRVPEDGLLRASCHVFFIDPELGNHEDHKGIAGRFVLYSDLGQVVERLRFKLDSEAQQQAKENDNTRKQGSASSNGDSDGDYSGIQLQGCCSQTSLNSNGSLPGSHPEQRVASWATCFERLLQDPVGVRYFSEFLKKEFSEENILFWQACEYYSHVPATDKKQLSQKAGEIYNSFLSSKATMPVNIDSQAQLADDVLTSPRPDMFKTQQLQIFNLMKFDSYSRFLKSSLYQECLRAEVAGQPLPDPYHIPCSPAPSKHSASSDRSTLSTPKKESRKPKSGKSPNEDSREESADKKRGIFFSWSRNRSFGKGPKKKDIGDIHLDYTSSNGRRESQGSLSSSASLEIPSSSKIESDNRHSVGAWERSPRPCSVLLPDGSCSSITLRPGASIREVLQDLCQNICVNIAAVDLFLVGGEKPLVLDQDCLTLCSRDLRLEKRTLFRLDLVPINRSVGLKAKPTKPVTEVLRPVVAKYGLSLSDLVAKVVSFPRRWLRGVHVSAPVQREPMSEGGELRSGERGTTASSSIPARWLEL
uniref:Regulator of G-protein signaling 12a n=1 Tax=Nothobranchius pienaari TaxID=704102 RepID=A0A1A8L9I4_9TELE